MKFEYKEGWTIEVGLHYGSKDRVRVTLTLAMCPDADSDLNPWHCPLRQDYEFDRVEVWSQFREGERRPDLYLPVGLGWGYEPDHCLDTVEQCVYHAVRHFELHEIDHFLKIDGTLLNRPHPE